MITVEFGKSPAISKALERWKEYFILNIPTPRLKGPRLPVERLEQCEMFPDFEFWKKPTRFYYSDGNKLWAGFSSRR
jgi:hypothetical protein